MARTQSRVLRLAVLALTCTTLLVGCGNDDDEEASTLKAPAQGLSDYVSPHPAGTKLGNENIARFQRLVEEGINQGKLEVMDELLAPDILDHQWYGPGYPPSRAGIKALTAALRTAFPDDLHAVATTLVASNDGRQTFAIIRTTGTHTGPYLGVPPSGRKIALDIEEAARWENGKMVEHWGVADNLGLLSQLGFFPPGSIPDYTPALVSDEYKLQLANPRPLKPTQALTVHEKLESVRRAVDVGVNTGDLYVDTELVSDDYVEYEFYGPGFPDGVERHKAAIAVNRTALPDLHTRILQTEAIGDGEHVFGIFKAAGTNLGPFLGIPPTGNPIEIDVFEYFHFDQNGKVNIHNGVADLLGLIDQLGFIPPGSVPAYSPDKVDPKFKALLATD